MKTKYNPEKHHRRSIRLPGFDYSSPGVYFITIRAQSPGNWFGEIVKGEMRLNEAGLMVERIWNGIPEKNPEVKIDFYMVMPDHFHGILMIMGESENDEVGKDIAGEHKVRPYSPSPYGMENDHDPNDRIKYADDGGSPDDASGSGWSGSGSRSKSCKGEPRVRPMILSTCPMLLSTRPITPKIPSIPNGTADGSIGRIIQAFKSITTNKYITGVKENDWQPFPGRLWQRNYYEHVVRNEDALRRIREYIMNNPVKFVNPHDSNDYPNFISDSQDI